MTRNSLGWLAGIALLLSACNTQPDEWARLSAIDCDAEALPGSFLRQAAGLFTPAELGARAPGPGDGPGHPDTAALDMGHFSFWTELVDQVPFPHPGNVVCQALLFDEAGDATAFVESLAPTAQNLSRAAIGWPFNGELDVREVTMEDEAEARRIFLATREGNDDSALEVVLLFEAVDYLVVSVHAGGREKDKEPGEWLEALDSLRDSAQRAIGD